MTATAHRTSLAVIENAAYAWRNVAKKVKDAWYAQLDLDFVHDYRTELDAAATKLFGPALIAEWTRRGYQVTPAPDGLVMQRRPKGTPHCEVWDTTCRALDPYAVVVTAGLDDVLLDYAAHRPRPEHLEAACAGLRPHHTRLRAELYHRLDRWATSFTDDTSETAWNQVEGLRNAVEIATSRRQLDHLAAQIPA